MKKILIVEDHPDMRELLSWQIRLMGLEPVTAMSAQEGVDKAIAEKPVLILMDVMLPGMDGREAVRMLRAAPATKDVPIIAATALFRSTDLQSCLDAGCNGYIAKPIDTRRFLAQVQAFLPGAAKPGRA